MIKIYELINNAKQSEYNEANAEAKVCQDIISNKHLKCKIINNCTLKLHFKIFLYYYMILK